MLQIKSYHSQKFLPCVEYLRRPLLKQKTTQQNQVMKVFSFFVLGQSFTIKKLILVIRKI